MKRNYNCSHIYLEGTKICCLLSRGICTYCTTNFNEEEELIYTTMRQPEIRYYFCSKGFYINEKELSIYPIRYV